VANNNLFSDFEAVSSKQWKQQIQYELKGADYNETLVWESPEGIKVKPFYHADDSEASETENIDAIVPTKPFAIVQNIFVHDVQKSNARALETLQ
jgi:methylmalonyl-CoA mutase